MIYTLLDIQHPTSKVESKLELGFVEEELYIKGNIVIWSKGLVTSTDDIDHPKATICAYSSPQPIKQAIWCTFHDQRPVLDQESESEHVSENKIPAVCVVDAENIRIFTSESEDYIDVLPFQVGNLWNTKYGILLEKQKDGKRQGVSTEENKNAFSLYKRYINVCIFCFINYSNPFCFCRRK